MSGAEAYNRLRGQSLTVLIMDTVRLRIAAGEEVTMRQLSKLLAEENNLTKPHQRDQLYDRVRTTVRNLADGGMLVLEKGYHKKFQVNITTIKLPPPPCSD